MGGGLTGTASLGHVSECFIPSVCFYFVASRNEFGTKILAFSPSVIVFQMTYRRTRSARKMYDSASLWLSTFCMWQSYHIVAEY